jgi:VIT1/CCC1 family predicted Fe2+/Mn2+ transporter
MFLLVSPCSIEEASRSLAADIIDVKRPAEGSLGANFPWVIRAVKGMTEKPVSAAIGDFDYRPGSAALAAYGAACAGADYIKIGLMFSGRGRARTARQGEMREMSAPEKKRSRKCRPGVGEKEWHNPSGKKIREILYGMMDGVVGTVGFLMGLFGATVDIGFVFVAALSATLAGAISMGLGGYLASKAQIEFFVSEFEREKREIKELPHIERREIEEIYRAKGFEGDELRMVVDRITSDEEVWLEVMMIEELGLVKESFDDPKEAGMLLAISYVIGSFAPILPFLFYMGDVTFYLSFVFGVLALVVLGLYRARVTKKGWMGLVEVVLIGVIAAVIGYLLGIAIGSIIPH